MRKKEWQNFLSLIAIAEVNV